jgi:hypothetical protein
MKSHLHLLAALGVLALASNPSAQTDAASLHRPLDVDFFFEEQADGSIVAADARGTHYVAGWTDYVQSPFFQEHGLRCGTDRVPQPLALGLPSDCNSSNTSIEAQYDPASPAACPCRRTPSPPARSR